MRNLIFNEFLKNSLKQSLKIVTIFCFICLAICESNANCDFQDWLALKKLYQQTDGGNWTNNTGWELVNYSSPPQNCDLSSMYGVEIYTNERVAMVELANNNLNGYLPQGIEALAQANKIDLSGNQLRGLIPTDIANLANQNLSELYLNNNQLSGCYDPALSALCSVNSIDIDSGNNFNLAWTDFCADTTAPCAVCNADNWNALKTLYTNTDGDNWVNNTGWEVVANHASPPANCDINGMFGVTAYTLPGITPPTQYVYALQLPSNNLVGDLPAEIADLTGMHTVNLSNNQITGSLPPNWFDFYNTDDLREVDLSNNQLSGNLPTDQVMVEIYSIDLSNNQFTGSIPYEYLYYLNEFSVNDNLLSGCFSLVLKDRCAYFSNAEISDGNNFDVTWDNFCQNDAGVCTTVDVALDIKYYLEGAYDFDTYTQRTVLIERGLLPGMTPISPLATQTPPNQPYNTAPWNYAGTEGSGFTNSDYNSDDVDWVLVSVRTDLDESTEVAKVAGILKKDGQIRFLANYEKVNIPNVASLHLVVEHRNHLPVMSLPVTMANGKLSFDFRSQDSYSDPTSFGQKEILPGVFAAYAGNALQDVGISRDDVNGAEKAIWQTQNGSFDKYLPGDMDLDADVNGSDKSIWGKNNGISSRVFQ